MFWILLLLFDIPETYLSCLLCIFIATVVKPQHVRNIIWGTVVAGSVALHAMWYQPLSIVVMLPLQVLAMLMIQA